MILPAAVMGHRIIPVMIIDDAGWAVDAAAALAAGGVGCVEITLRTPAGLGAIAAVAAVGSSVVGAGTVLTADDVDRVADAGARFVVTPGFDPEVVARAVTLGLDVLPGTATATDVQAALRAGLSAVKLFPADRLGGLGMIAALAGPFPNVAFVPSGGVSPDNLADYLEHLNVPAVSGSWMVTRELLATRNAVTIERLSREASAIALAAAP